MKRKTLTRQQVLNIAKSRGTFTVHRFKYSQSNLRSRLRQMANDLNGPIVYLGKDGDTFYYRFQGIPTDG